MGFNAKAFATSFLNSQATGINERLADAKKYKEEQEDLARNNIGLYKKRKQQMMMRVRMGKAMKDWGASHAQVLAYANSGAGALQEAYKALMAARGLAGISGDQKLQQTTVDAILGTADSFTDDKTSIEDFMAKTSGIYKDLMDTETEDKSDPAVQEGNWMLAAMGYGAKDRARRTLREKQIFEGMTVQGLNDLARTEDIQQVLPGDMSSLKVIPQNITTEGRNRIFDNFNEWAKDGLPTHFDSLGVTEKAEMAASYGLDSARFREQIAAGAGEIFEKEKAKVVSKYLDSIGNPFTESLILSRRYLSAETGEELPQGGPTGADPRTDDFDAQKDLAVNYPDAPSFDLKREDLEGLNDIIVKNNFEGGDVIILNDGKGDKWVVLSDAVVSAAKEPVERDNIENLDRIIHNLITRNVKSSLMNKLDDYRLKPYLKKNPSQIPELMKDPEAWLQKNINIFSEDNPTWNDSE